MPPSDIIDSDLDGTALYVLERSKLWKGTPVGAGTATWSLSLDAETYASELPGLQFSRVRVVGGIVYVTGGTVPEGEGTGSAYCFMSRTGGFMWSFAPIADASYEIAPFTVTHAASAVTVPVGGDVHWRETHRRVGDDESTINPWGIAVEFLYPEDSAGMLYADADTISSDGTATNLGMLEIPSCAHEDSLSGPEALLMIAFWEEYFGVLDTHWRWLWTGHVANFPKDAARTKMHCSNNQPGQTLTQSWVFWNKPNPLLPVALDAYRGRPEWVYVGGEDKIYKSEDGGYTWTVLVDGDGANDILVDPQLGGMIYTWSPSGSLKVYVEGALNASLATETPIRKPLRLARSPNSGRLWALPGGTTLQMRNLGSWTTQQTGLSGATGVHAYLGDKLIFVDGSEIYISDDGGTTVAAKKGGWSGFSGGINAHRIAT